MNALANHIAQPGRYRVGLCLIMRPDGNVKEMMGYYLQCYLIALGRKTIDNQSFKKSSTGHNVKLNRSGYYELHACGMTSGIAITTTRCSVWFMAPMQLRIIAHSLLLNYLRRITKHNRFGVVRVSFRLVRASLGLVLFEFDF